MGKLNKHDQDELANARFNLQIDHSLTYSA